MFAGINLPVSRMFDTTLETMIEPVMLNYGVPNFTIKVMTVLFRYIIFLADLCQLTTEFQPEEMQGISGYQPSQ